MWTSMTNSFTIGPLGLFECNRQKWIGQSLHYYKWWISMIHCAWPSRTSLDSNVLQRLQKIALIIPSSAISLWWLHKRADVSTCQMIAISSILCLDFVCQTFVQCLWMGDGSKDGKKWDKNAETNTIKCKGHSGSVGLVGLLSRIIAPLKKVDFLYCK